MLATKCCDICEKYSKINNTYQFIKTVFDKLQDPLIAGFVNQLIKEYEETAKIACQNNAPSSNQKISERMDRLERATQFNMKIISTWVKNLEHKINEHQDDN